ncbi:MAG: HEAT repeat domain-containing protein [Elusimicrobia bacterium]|nr:HEAT repeat domain-containing protein [Elusimicrobiota bacterium]
MILEAVLLTAALAADPAPAPTPPPSSLAPRTHSRKLLLSTLLSSLKDKEEDIRARAAEDIGKLDPPAVEAVDDLIKALKDKAPVVRHRAAEALDKIGTPKGKKAVYQFRKKMGREKFSW